MEFEVLKRNHLKRNIIIGLIAVLLISVVILNFTKAKYRVTESIPLVNGTINYSLADLNAVAVYINGDNGYTKTDTIPESEYVLNEEESYCTIDGNRDNNISLSYDVTTKSLSVSPMTTKRTKCYLYFDTEPITIQDIIASKTIATRDDFSTTLTSDTTGTIYQAEDDDGTTYYFAGNVTDNWVRWAGFYWRIIRINGDGTLRLIYNGTSTTTTGRGTQISTSDFNSTDTDNMYVGFKYTANNVHGTETNSTILGILNAWYQNTLQSHADDIEMNAGFCNDKTPYSGSGIGTTTYYAAYNRLNTNKSPSFKCSNSSDLFTVSSSNKGNKALQYPIGLITADEVAYAGGVYERDNTSYYLYTNQDYWTMSPSLFFSRLARVLIVYSTGYLNGNYRVNSTTIGVHPVINLRADVQFSEGNGTSETPFVVS